MPASLWIKLRKKLRNKAATPTLASRHVPPASWPLLQNYDQWPKIDPQVCSPLFNKFSTELRLMVYTLALGDLGGMVHLMQDRGGRKRVAHYRCADASSPYPSWQHRCYGIYREPMLPYHVVRRVTITEDQLLGMLLACRRVYSESLEVLYGTNIFHFRNTTDFLDLHQRLTSPHWNALRHIYIASTFLANQVVDYLFSSWPPDSLTNWDATCKCISEMENLHSLTLEVFIGVQLGYNRLNLDWTDAKQRLFKSILGPLKPIKVTSFRLQSNIHIPEQELDGLSCTTFVKKIQLNDEDFPENVDLLPEDSLSDT